jgi:glyoxylase-like metal-dependent hydrolase (beta-lactamase superfamily II)
MNIFQYPLGQLQANCYLLVEDDSCILIDPADNASFILEEIERKRLTLQGLIATHGHFDHLMAVGEIQLSYQTRFGTDLPLFIHPKDQFLLKRLVQTAKHFLDYEPAVIPIQSTEDLKMGKQKLGDFSFEVIHTPGHTPGSCSIHFPERHTLFTGDTLFQGAIGGYDHAYSDKEELFKSVNFLLKLPPETEVYAGHGESTLIASEELILSSY